MSTMKQGMKEVMNTGAFDAFKDIQKKKKKRTTKTVASEWGII